jgi:hypothetical protein
MQIKKLLSNSAYWTINKELARDIGLDATIVLQHFIDLQSSFFEDGGFYQQQDRIIKDLPITIDYLRKAVKVLVNKGFLSVVKKGVPAKNHYTVLEGNIMAYMSSITRSTREASLEVSGKDDKRSTRGTTNTKNKNTNNKDTNNIHSVYDNIYDKLIKDWPKTRIQSKNPVIKYLKTKSKEDIVLILKNKSRYLKANDGYVKNLRNYLEHEDWTDTSIQEYETNGKKTTITNKSKTFTGNYDDLT